MSLSLEEAVRAHLLGSTAIVALVVDRIMPQTATMRTVRPFIVYNRISSDHQHHSGGASGMLMSRLQLDLFATTYTQCRALGEAVRNRIDGYRGTVTTANGSLWLQRIEIVEERDGYVPPTDGSDIGAFHLMIDLSISAAEPIPTLT